MPSWLRGRPALLLPVSQLAAYPGDAIEYPAKPVVAFPHRGDDHAGLVMHDPESTTFIPLPDGGLLAQLICTDDSDLAVAALADAVPSEGWEDLGFSYDTPDAESLLFESLYEGASLDDPDTLANMEDMDCLPVRVPLAPGRYRVAGMVGHRPDAATEWSLVRLTRTA